VRKSASQQWQTRSPRSCSRTNPAAVIKVRATGDGPLFVHWDRPTALSRYRKALYLRPAFRNPCGPLTRMESDRNGVCAEQISEYAVEQYRLIA